MHPHPATPPETVLILGARGRFGLAAARAFADAGWRVLAQTRPGRVTPPAGPIEWLGIDLHDTPTLAHAARGATVVVHALSPAYTNAAWQAQVLPMTDAALAVTRALRATLMVPGNVYNFGPAMPHVLREGTPQLADTVKGQVRIAMEQRLRQSGVPSIVVRAGDFFGSGSGTWFDTVLVKDLSKGVFTDPGAPGVPRAWAYLPDLAQTFVAVARRRAVLPAFAVLHFAGHRITGQRWLDVLTPLAQVQGWVAPGRAVKRAALPWPIIRLGAFFMPTWAALLEMRYLWQTPHALANDALTALIGAEPHTPLPQAAQAALVDLGLLVAPTPADLQTANANAIQPSGA